MSRRETPLLPVSDAREAALFFVVGALCFLAALAALSAGLFLMVGRLFA